MSPESVLAVTGAGGFIGRALVERGLAAGLRVRAGLRSPGDPPPGAERVVIDLLSPPTLEPFVRGADTVVHAAGLAHRFGRETPDAAEFRRINAEGSERIAEAAVKAGVRHLVLLSSMAVYGPGRGSGLDEDAPCRPDGDYAESKLEGERRARAATEPSGLRLSILRLATVYGEGDPGNVARLMRSIDLGRFVWIGDGSNRKSLVHRDDAADAVLLAAARTGEPTRVFNVSAPPCPMADVVNGLARALGKATPSWRIPAVLAKAAGWFAGRSRRGTLRKWLSEDVLDAGRAARELGFRSRVSLDEGLKREAAWYRSRG